MSEIVIQFRRTPHLIFQRHPAGADPNVMLDFRYGEVFGGSSPEAYERLLLDAIHGDATLYARGDWVEQAWTILAPVLEAWAHAGPPLATYDAGSWGPGEADAFIERAGA